MDFDLSSWAMTDFHARNPRFAPKPNGARRRVVAWSLTALVIAAAAAGAYLAPTLATVRGDLQGASRVSAGEVLPLR